LVWSRASGDWQEGGGTTYTKLGKEGEGGERNQIPRERKRPSRSEGAFSILMVKREGESCGTKGRNVPGNTKKVCS